MITNKEYLDNLKDELKSKRDEYNVKLSNELTDGDFREYQKYDRKREIVQAQIDIVIRIKNELEELKEKNKKDIKGMIKEGKLMDAIKEYKDGN